MDEFNSSLGVVLAITSDTAFLELEGVTNLARAANALEASFTPAILVIAATEMAAVLARQILEAGSIRYELLICEPTVPKLFAQALAPWLGHYDAIMIHDASRPFTPPSQFDDVIAALEDDVDAVRPTIAFTETLKIVGNDNVIVETLDRTSVTRIGTPELIRVSAIDTEGQDCGWFLPLKSNARLHQIEGSPEGSRINTPADRDLMELHSN